MYLTRRSHLLKKEEKDLIKFYYSFFNNLNGNFIWNKIRNVHFTSEVSKLNILDKLDSNLIDAIESVLMVRFLENIYFLLVLDEDKEILGVSRYEIENESVKVSEIIVKNVMYESIKLKVINLILDEYEKIVQENNLSSVIIEVPWFDINYLQVATDNTYEAVDLDGKTYIFEKNVVKDNYGRNLTRK